MTAASACQTMRLSGERASLWVGSRGCRGSDRGGSGRVMYSPIVTAKMTTSIAWLADVLARIAEHPAVQARRTAAMELALSHPER